jgi:hypothetical protein
VVIILEEDIEMEQNDSSDSKTEAEKAREAYFRDVLKVNLPQLTEDQEQKRQAYFNKILTTSKGFFENKIVLKMIQDLKNSGIKMEGEFTEGVSTGEDTFEMFHQIQNFENVTGEKTDFLYNVLEKDEKDIFKFIFFRAKDGIKIPYLMVPFDLVFFAVIKYFPDQLEKFMSMIWVKTAKQKARMFKKQYNEALGIEDKK